MQTYISVPKQRLFFHGAMQPVTKSENTVILYTKLLLLVDNYTTQTELTVISVFQHITHHRCDYGDGDYV